MSTELFEKYYLEARDDGADMTAAIEEKLREYGTCVLGTGTYVVNGVNMPDHTSIIGLGRSTTLLLDESVKEGYAVKIASYCTVKNIGVVGSKDLITLPEEVGERHGLKFEGTIISDPTIPQPAHSIVEGCFIRSFTGGGLTCTHSGGSVRCAVTASNCHIFNCGAGINIPFRSEYHQFANMLCTGNLYGCINNGGNNDFANCGFNSNITGYLIDNTDSKSPNNSHGTISGCTFNHTNKNTGIGILIKNASHGYVFTGCQIFYSQTVIENSNNIHLNACNYGRDEVITVKGGVMNMFTNCLFKNQPQVTVEDNELFRFINCFTSKGEEVTVNKE